MEEFLKIGGFALSIIVLLKGVLEYTRAQRWKKAEFVSKEIKEFLNDFNVKRALLILDWNANDLSLAANELGNKTTMHFTDKLILTALRTHHEAPVFTDEEVLIKGIFDVFLDKLSMFNNYMDTGLIKPRDIKPYLEYWIDILANPASDRKSSELRTQIWKYIDEYNYTGVRVLCHRLGFDGA